MATHLLVALAAGSLVGLERTYHGRAAGFRTHALVCMASALLMLLSVYQVRLLPGLPIETVRIDPTRMGQGIMTGIGFLGAGVIMKEGLTIRGLTTAASIWITAAIGILVGVGFYFPALTAVLLVLVVLALFRRIEAAFPSLSYAHLTTRFLRERHLPQQELLTCIHENGMTASDVAYRLVESGKFFEYELTIQTPHTRNFERLAQTLARMERVIEFAITPAGSLSRRRNP